MPEDISQVPSENLKELPNMQDHMSMHNKPAPAPAVSSEESNENEKVVSQESEESTNTSDPDISSNKYPYAKVMNYKSEFLKNSQWHNTSII